MQTVPGNADKVRINKRFVDCWSSRYDWEKRDTSDLREEQRLKKWLAEQSEPRSLDKDHFVDLAVWKSPRPKPRYKRNDGDLVCEVTQIAFQASDESLRVHVLMALDGVGMPVASALLHFAFPDRYPILDFRVVRTLRRAGRWQGGEAPDFTLDEWLKFTKVMRDLARELGVHMRDLDKALWVFDWAFDKWPPEAEGGCCT